MKSRCPVRRIDERDGFNRLRCSFGLFEFGLPALFAAGAEAFGGSFADTAGAAATGIAPDATSAAAFGGSDFAGGAAGAGEAAGAPGAVAGSPFTGATGWSSTDLATGYTTGGTFEPEFGSAA